MDAAKVLELVLALTKGQSGVGGGNEESPFEVGKQYFIRTVTYHLTGKLVAIKGKFLLFDEAAWIADSGRFNKAVTKGIDKSENSEIEPWEHQVFVNMDSIVDGIEYPYSLPKDQK